MSKLLSLLILFIPLILSAPQGFLGSISKTITNPKSIIGSFTSDNSTNESTTQVLDPTVQKPNENSWSIGGSIVQTAESVKGDSTRVLNSIGKAVSPIKSNATKVATSVGKGIQTEIVAIKHPIVETISYVGTSQCANVKKLFGVSYEQLEGEHEPDLNQLTLDWRDSSVSISYNITSAARLIPQSRGFNPSRPLVIFIHGFTDDPTGAGSRNITSAFMNIGEYQVLSLDGSSLIKWLYLRSTTYVRFMGEKLGETLAAMVKSGVNPQSIHIIGHSLGSHIAAFAGKTFRELTGSQVGRISGLDPAGPCFSAVDPTLRLKATDAAFVDVIHTDAGVYGMKEPVGQVDFYPNGGSQQPSCLLQSCSHSRAWLLFAESVAETAAFPAAKCADWELFRNGLCDYNDITYMGYAAKPGTRGLYFLQTNGERPYGKKEQGLRFENNEGVVRNLFG